MMTKGRQDCFRKEKLPDGGGREPYPELQKERVRSRSQPVEGVVNKIR